MSVEAKVGRRSLFSHFNPYRNLEKQHVEHNPTSSMPRKGVVFSRREFGKLALGTAASIAINSVTGSTPAVHAQEKTPVPRENPLVSSLRARSEHMDAGSLLSSFAQGAAWGVVNSVVGRFLARKGLPIENPAQQDNGPVANLASSLVVSPFIQELAFREFPRIRFASGESMRWDVGLVSSVLFTLYHNIHGTFAPPSIKIDTKRIHALAFPMGFFLWWKVKREGYYHAVATHLGHNAGVTIYSLLKKNL